VAFVVADREVVAGSGYAAEGRRALPETIGSEPWAFAAEVAAELDPPEDVYVLDVCESDGRLRLLELNPFSGADLYACDADNIVSAVSRVAERG
jgi:glutathione synthase/RimK-type ligase-like ATP-grasp enzyme